MPEGHPERADRIDALVSHLASPDGTEVSTATRSATTDELLRVHDRDHIDRVAATEGVDFTQFDPDTHAGADSNDIALLAAGGVLDIVDRVIDGRSRNGFALVRPPGHHAERNRPMGFCLFNNIAVAAAHAVEACGLDRVLIIDWDVHHGNGTEHIFANDPRVLFISTHQYPFYPGTGAVEDVGNGDGKGFTVNVPMPAGCGDDDYNMAFDAIVEPVADAFRPQLILISAGYDAHESDPLGGMRVTKDGFISLAARVRGIAERHAGGRWVASLEGGYSLTGLVEGVQATLDVMAGGDEPATRPSGSPRPEWLERAVEVHSSHWTL
jgi:acetoin utilization deacetylase AcuC-like enzyme